MPALTLPPAVLAGLSGHARRTVELWWDQLADRERDELLTSWRAPESMATRAAEGECREDDDDDELEPAIEFELHGVWVGEEEDGPSEGELWWRYFFEYEMDHPGTFDWMPAGRVFHVGCRAHPAARAAVKRAWIPADFRCPFAHDGCPWRAALDQRPGLSIRLSVRIRLRRRPRRARA